MEVQQALLIASILVILFGFIASLMIRETADARKAKPFFVGYFVSSFITTFIFIELPYLTETLHPAVLDLIVILNITCLSIGLSIRFNKNKVEKLCYLTFVLYAIVSILGLHNFMLFLLITLTYLLLSLYTIVTRKPKSNKADLGLLVTLILWVSITLLNMMCKLGEIQLATDKNDVMPILIFNPALTCGVAIFLLTSYMMDSNALLDRLASKDPLTDMLNRRALLERIVGQINYLKRHNKQASVILADIDKFKQINDSYGHEAGDEAIKQFASIITHAVREYDIPARYGGEEFLIFLPDASVEVAVNVADRIRTECENRTLPYGDKEIVFTASFGVAEFQLNREPDVSIAEADKALYLAKSSGRNNVKTNMEG